MGEGLGWLYIDTSYRALYILFQCVPNRVSTALQIHTWTVARFLRVLSVIDLYGQILVARWSKGATGIVLPSTPLVGKFIGVQQ